MSRSAIAPQSASATDAKLFFALWPDDAARAVLARLGQSLNAECGGRATPAHNLHLTLAFLGNVAVVRLAELRALAAAIVAPRFEFTLDTLGYWRHNRVVWAGATECPQALHELAGCLVRVLKIAGFPCDERAHAPHVTLLRNARRAPAAGGTGGIAWRAADFALVQSLRENDAVIYRVMARWPLGAVAQTRRIMGGSAGEAG